MSRDAGGTENLQKSAVFDAVKKKKCKHLQTQNNRFFAHSHSLTRFLADSCSR